MTVATVWRLMVLCMLGALVGHAVAQAVQGLDAAHASAPLTLAVQPGWSPIVTYDPTDARLTVTRHLRADALVCIRETCHLAAEWVAR